MDIVTIGILASLGAGLMTGVGAVPVLFGRDDLARGRMTRSWALRRG